METPVGSPSRRTSRRLSARPLLMVAAIVLAVQIPGILAVKRATYTPWSIDFKDYYGPAAESILNGQGPRLPDGRLLVHYPPGYPFYAAALMAGARATGTELIGWVIAGNLAWNLLTVAAMFLLGWRLAGRGLAIASGLLAGLYPPVLYLSKIAFVQVPYLTFLAWGLYAAWMGHSRRRLGWLALSGALYGVAGLLRPAALAMLAILLLYVLVFFRGSLPLRLLRPAVMLAAFLAVIAPWSVYVYVQQGQVIVLGDVAGAHLEGSAVAAASADSGGIQGVRHFGELLRHPLSHGAEIARRAIKSWYHTDSGRYETAAGIINIPFAALLVLGLRPSLRGPWRWGAGLALSAFLAAWGLSTLTIYLARYVATGLVLASPVTAAGALRVLDKCRRRGGETMSRRTNGNVEH